MNSFNPTALLVDLCRQGVQLHVTEDRQRIAAPVGALTPELRSALITHKMELLGLLSRMEDYKALLQRTFAHVAARRGMSSEEIQKFLDDQTRLLDELGPTLLTTVFDSTVATWRETMATCPWCGGTQGTCHPTPPRRS
jgi:hypothetical protein